MDRREARVTDDPPGPPAVLHAWALLRRHPALMWVPPLWRAGAPGPAAGDTHAVRAIDRNLILAVAAGPHGRCTYRLGTGPLRDRELGDGVDPTAPAPTHDPRLDVEAATFDQALCALADRVLTYYGPVETAAPLRMAAPSDEDGDEGAEARVLRRAVRG